MLRAVVEHDRRRAQRARPCSAASSRGFRMPTATIVGPGDDAAVIAAPDARFVVTTDMMVHGPDFRLAWSTPFELGWKAAATNLSDVAAMGAVPTALVVAIAVPPVAGRLRARGHRRRTARRVRRPWRPAAASSAETSRHPTR